MKALGSGPQQVSETATGQITENVPGHVSGRIIVAGIGFRADSTAADLSALLARAETLPDAVATLSGRAATSGFRAFAKAHDLGVITLDEEDIAGEQTMTCSPRIKARFGTGSVAEAAALVAARRFGPARLIAPRLIGPDGATTLALAEAVGPKVAAAADTIAGPKAENNGNGRDDAETMTR